MCRNGEQVDRAARRRQIHTCPDPEHHVRHVSRRECSSANQRTDLQRYDSLLDDKLRIGAIHDSNGATIRSASADSALSLQTANTCCTTTRRIAPEPRSCNSRMAAGKLVERVSSPIRSTSTPFPRKWRAWRSTPAAASYKAGSVVNAAYSCTDANSSSPPNTGSGVVLCGTSIYAPQTTYNTGTLKTQVNTSSPGAEDLHGLRDRRRGELFIRDRRLYGDAVAAIEARRRRDDDLSRRPRLLRPAWRRTGRRRAV